MMPVYDSFQDSSKCKNGSTKMSTLKNKYVFLFLSYSHTSK